MRKFLILALALFPLAAFAADTSVPNMTAGAAMSDTDLIYCLQSSGTTDRKCTGAQLKTYAVTSAVRATTSTSEALANSDQGKLVTFSNGSAVACTIAQAGSGGNFAAGWAVSLKNLGAGTVTCTPTTSTVDGAASFTLTTGQGLDLYSDGTNYFTQPGAARNASDLSTGTLAAARGGAGTINGALKGNGSGVVSQAACADLSDDGALCSTTPGTGVATAIAANLSAAGGLTTTIGSGTKAMATSAIASGACTSAQTLTVTGTATTDVVLVGFNGDPTAVTGFAPSANGMLTVIAYPTADTVNIKECNNTASSITPGAHTFNVRVVR
jgi:hypothetical protein